MKKIFKILVVFFVGLSIIVSSCKKEDNKPVGDTTSEDINGCTDSSAMNYLSNATSNDGSCIFAYAIAQGVWNISSECEDLTINIVGVLDTAIPLNDMLPPTIEITGVLSTGEGAGVVSLDVDGDPVLADIANNGSVTIQDNQTIAFEVENIGEVDVNITGLGKIETATNGDLTVHLIFDLSPLQDLLPIPLPITANEPSCEITFTK